MEKTKLVRTFGTALATATLSFGLFAAPAIADNQTIEADDTLIIIGDDKDDVATAGEWITIEIPVEIGNVKKFQNKDSKMTFKASDGTFEQEFTLLYSPEGEANDKFWFVLGEADDLGQRQVEKIKAKFDVKNQMLNGTWTFDELKLSKFNGEDVEIKGVDLSFVVEDNDDPEPLAFDVESITVARSVVIRTRDNFLMVNGKFGESPVTGTATYANPAGVEKDFDLEVGGPRFALVSELLPTGVEGEYTLTKLTATRVDLGDVDTYRMLTTSVVYDDIDLSQGDYVVTKTGVEAMVRLYNPWTGEHIYTNDGVEQIAAVAAGWVYEGLAWYAPVNGLYQGAVAPVYRVYNQYNGEHHYTTSSVEALTLVAAGWTDEGVGFYTTTKGDALAQPVYRLFNPFATVGTHHYTIGEDEYNDLQTVGWKGEGVGWYGVKPFGDLIDED